MDKFEIEGGVRLDGEVVAGGSKNAALPILFASILCPGTLSVKRVPRLRDINTTFELLRTLGFRADFVGENSVAIDAKNLNSFEAPYDLVRTMRASVLMLGPLLAREKRAKVSLPGGCAIGSRPVDLHLSGLEKMGASFRIEQGYINGECPNGLRGTEISFRFPSVGATENILMAAVLAKGRTEIKNAAREPEIVDLARALVKMGAIISGAGTETIIIDGVTNLKPASVEVMFDRIEAGTLLLAGPVTGGSVRVNDVNPNDLSSYLDVLKNAGVSVSSGADWIEAKAGDLKPIKFSTAPFPGFPTDLQAQLMALLALVPGKSEVEETIFENRFMHVPELNRLGADIRVDGGRASIHGKPNCYSGATVMATDLRASASLVLAGLAAKGKTAIRRIYHLDRGYERLEDKLAPLGAEITRSRE
jgi:UDP-N-acetylglucosamine 1-carboxyvinyltransferase